MSKNFGPGLMGGVVLIDPETGQTYKGADFSVADLSNPATPAGASLSSTYARQPSDLKTWQRNEVVEARYGSGFFFKGINTGYPSTAGLGRCDATWILSWSAEWVENQIDTIAEMGANTWRVQGGYHAYVLDPAAYLAHVHQAFDYAHANHLRVLFTLTDMPGDWSTTVAATPTEMANFKAMIDAVMDGYVDNPLMIWDPGNEMPSTRTAEAIELAQYIRAKNPAGLICANTSTINSNLWQIALDPYVDVHDFHYYYRAGEVDLGVLSAIETYRAATRKPIIIGEVGTNGNATTGNTPHAPDEAERVTYLRRMGLYAARGDVAGLIAWKLTDTTSVHKFGLIDSSGNPTAQMAEVVKWPDRRVAYVKTLLDYSDVPIVLDDFGRANSTTSVGTSPLGGSPTASLGTWGISTRDAYRVGNAGGLALNILTWEANTTNPVVEAEFTIPNAPAEAVVGIVFRYVDASNFWLWRYKQSTGALSLLRYTAGTPYNESPPNLWAGSTATNADLTGFAPWDVVRMGVRGNGGYLHLYWFDRVFRLPWSTAHHLGATKHGVAIGDIDTGSKVARASISIPRRIF